MKELKKLIDLKTIITISITGALIYGFVMNKIDGKDFLVYVTMVYTFYFAKKDKGDDNMATTDKRTEEEIKESLKEDYKKVEEKKED